MTEFQTQAIALLKQILAGGGGSGGGGGGAFSASDITGQPDISAFGTGDTFVVYDASGSALAKGTVDELLTWIEAQALTFGAISDAGTPGAIVLTHGTGLPVSTGVSGLGTGVATALAVNNNSAGGYSPINGTATLTNKRISARVGSTASSATPTINTDNYDIYKLTAQTADITSFTTNLSGTPVSGDQLEIRVTGTAARAITWGASFAAGPVALPTTTVTTKTLRTYFEYDSDRTIWVCMYSGSDS